MSISCSRLQHGTVESVNLSGPAFTALKSFFPTALLSEATRHVVQQQVHIDSMQHTQAGLVVDASIFDSHYIDDYNDVTVHLVLSTDGTLDFECSFDYPQMCSHIGAVFLLSFDAWKLPQAGPTWRSLFDRTLPSAQDREPSVEVCLFVSIQQERTYRRGGAPGALEPTLGFRPGMRGKRGAWIKGNAKWESLTNLDANRRQLRALTAFERAVSGHESSAYYWGSHHEWLTVGDVPAEDLLHAFTRLQDSGIPFVSHGGKQLEAAFSPSQLTPAVQATREGDHVNLRAELRFETPVRDALPLGDTLPLGNPVMFIAQIHDRGASTERFTIFQLTTPLPPVAGALIAHNAPLEIPADEIGTFESEILPRLQTVVTVDSPDDSYKIPLPPTVTLSLSIVYGDKQTHVTWEWARPVGVSVPAQESAIIDALHEACSSHTGLLWPTLAAESTPVDLPSDATYGLAATAQFIAEVLPRIRATVGINIVEEGSTTEYRAAEEAPLVSVQSEAAGDWFNLHFTVTVEGEEVEFSELFTALAFGEPVFVLPSGTYFPLTGPEFTKLRDIIEEARALTDHSSGGTDNEVRVTRYQVDLWDELSELGIVAAQEAEWWLAVQTLGEIETMPQVAPPAGLNATLRDYQLHGMSWLHFLRTHGLGGILADDMGLGKTLQTIGMMELAREADPEMKPFLVVAPTSVVGNWGQEIARFAPGLRVATVTSMTSRRKQSLRETVQGAHVVVTSYALFRGKAEEYRELEWSGLILDEAQQIKNSVSHGYRAARALGAPFTVVITGTPIENNLLELWSLTSLAAPGLLGSKQRFTDYFRTPIEKQHSAERLTLLQRRLRPFLLRRTKDLVASELPAKQEQMLEIELHPKHRKLYDVRFQRERQRLLGLLEDTSTNRFQIFQSLTMLRQLALDPALVGEGEAPSAKLDALIELLSDAAAEGHRVLVLSQFTRFLSSARDRATAANLPSQYLDGATVNRQSVIDKFRTGTDPVFFVSLKAGGFGLNLVEADYVVLLDPWWNPAVEAQAIDRTHRIGQTKPVFVYRLVAANTIEQKVIALRESKAELFARVLDGSGALDGGALSAAEITSLLE